MEMANSSASSVLSDPSMELTNSQEVALLSSSQEHAFDDLSADLEDCTLVKEEDIFKNLTAFVMELIQLMPEEQQEDKVKRYTVIKHELLSKVNEGRKSLRKQRKKVPKTLDLKKHLLENLRRHSFGWKHYQSPTSIAEGIVNIKECLKIIDQLSSDALHYYIQIGYLLKHLKRIDGKIIIPKLREQGISYSISYVNFLIRLFDLVERYPKLQYLSLSIRFIKQNVKQIVDEVKKDPKFWEM